MSLSNSFWWFCFVFVGLIIQALAPGIDVLVIGFIVLLQDRDLVQLLWIAPCLLFLQEGMGSLDFGTTLLWYATIATLYFIGCFLFESSTFFFMILLGLGVGLSNIAFTLLMATLQYHEVDTTLLIYESVAQGLLLPFCWKLISISRSWISYDPTKY